MINPSDYSCDKCARECSQHCKYCLHTADKPPTKFKKKKTGRNTPEYKHLSQTPNPNYTPPASVTKPKPPNTGFSVQKPCKYKTPCGWCTKWDKKCDRKISEDQKSYRPRTHLGLYLDDMMPNLSTYISAYSNNSHIDTKEED